METSNTYRIEGTRLLLEYFVYFLATHLNRKFDNLLKKIEDASNTELNEIIHQVFNNEEIFSDSSSDEQDEENTPTHNEEAAPISVDDFILVRGSYTIPVIDDSGLKVYLPNLIIKNAILQSRDKFETIANERECNIIDVRTGNFFMYVIYLCNILFDKFILNANFGIYREASSCFAPLYEFNKATYESLRLIIKPKERMRRLATDVVYLDDFEIKDRTAKEDLPEIIQRQIEKMKSIEQGRETEPLTKIQDASTIFEKPPQDAIIIPEPLTTLQNTRSLEQITVRNKFLESPSMFKRIIVDIILFVISLLAACVSAMTFKTNAFGFAFPHLVFKANLSLKIISIAASAAALIFLSLRVCLKPSFQKKLFDYANQEDCSSLKRIGCRILGAHEPESHAQIDIEQQNTI
jgi:hypothetical protein